MVFTFGGVKVWIYRSTWGNNFFLWPAMEGWYFREKCIGHVTLNFMNWAINLRFGKPHAIDAAWGDLYAQDRAPTAVP